MPMHLALIYENNTVSSLYIPYNPNSSLGCSGFVLDLCRCALQAHYSKSNNGVLSLSLSLQLLVQPCCAHFHTENLSFEMFMFVESQFFLDSTAALKSRQEAPH